MVAARGTAHANLASSHMPTEVPIIGYGGYGSLVNITTWLSNPVCYLTSNLCRCIARSNTAMGLKACRKKAQLVGPEKLGSRVDRVDRDAWSPFPLATKAKAHAWW